MEINKIYNENCLETMAKMPDGFVDLIVTDPPYGVNLEYDVYDDTENNWKKLMIDFIPEAKRVAKMVIMPSCRIKSLPFIYSNFPPDWLIAWHKGSPGHSAYIGFNDTSIKSLFYNWDMENWKAMHQEETEYKGYSKKKLTDAFCGECNYISDRVSYDRLFRTHWLFLRAFDKEMNIIKYPNLFRTKPSRLEKPSA